MAIHDLSDLPRGAPLLGLDLGTKTISVAASDALWMIASPLETIPKTQFTKDAAAVFRLRDSRHGRGIVIGLPVNMDGTEGPRAQSARAFARNLLRLDPDIPIAFWDERLSSAAVNRMMIDEMDLTRNRRAELVDKLAAVPTDGRDKPLEDVVIESITVEEA